MGCGGRWAELVPGTALSRACLGSVIPAFLGLQAWSSGLGGEAESLAQKGGSQGAAWDEDHRTP